jgi:hypothetical protein
MITDVESGNLSVSIYFLIAATIIAVILYLIRKRNNGKQYPNE